MTAPPNKLYCYICLAPLPCAPDAPCHAFTGNRRKKARMMGYGIHHRADLVARNTRWRAEKKVRPQVTARRRIDREADKRRKEFAANLLLSWVAADRRDREERRQRNIELAQQLSAKERIRKEAYAARLRKAKEYYEECLTVLATYNGPGGGKSYCTPEEAQAARRKYKTAYATVWSKTPQGRASSRNNDAAKRLSPNGIRARRPPGVGEFYRRMCASPKRACFYCGADLAPEERFADHFIPLAKGGNHDAANLVIACQRCNLLKTDRMPDEFIAWLNLNTS